MTAALLPASPQAAAPSAAESPPERWLRRAMKGSATAVLVAEAVMLGFSHDIATTMARVPGGGTGFLLISIPAIMLFGPSSASTRADRPAQAS